MKKAQLVSLIALAVGLVLWIAAGVISGLDITNFDPDGLALVLLQIGVIATLFSSIALVAVVATRLIRGEATEEKK